MTSLSRATITSIHHPTEVVVVTPTEMVAARVESVERAANTVKRPQKGVRAEKEARETSTTTNVRMTTIYLGMTTGGSHPMVRLPHSNTTI